MKDKPPIPENRKCGYSKCKKILKSKHEIFCNFKCAEKALTCEKCGCMNKVICDCDSVGTKLGRATVAVTT